MLSLYTGFLLFLLFLSVFTETSFMTLAAWTGAFALMDIVFGVLQPSVWKLIDVRNIRIKPLLLIILICTGSGFLVSYSATLINLEFFGEDEGNYALFSGLEFPLLSALFIMAVCPAIFEELAFRGFIYNNLKVLGSHTSAIWGSAFLFALVHLSFLSLIWIFPFGLLLGYFRRKYATIIYGIAGHFVHNSVVTLIEHYGIY